MPENLTSETWECVPRGRMLSGASQCSLPSPPGPRSTFPASAQRTSSPRGNSPGEQTASSTWFPGRGTQVCLGFSACNSGPQFPDRKTCFQDATIVSDNIAVATPTEVGWEVMVLIISWTWQDSELRAAWRLGGSGLRGQGLLLDDLVDVSYSLKDLPLVGYVWRF